MKHKALLIVAISMFFVMTVSSSAFAAWYTVTINKVGGTSSGVRVQITDDGGAFSKTWFDIVGSQRREIYAAVLTAASSKEKLSVQLNSIDEFSDLTGCYMLIDD